MRTAITIATCAAVLSLPAVPAAAAEDRETAASAPRIGLAIKGRANHRRPLPRERQTIRWTVTNTGRTRLAPVLLRVEAPATWRVLDSAGCRADAGLLHCDLSALAPGARVRITHRFRVNRDAQPGPVRIVARTRIGTELGERAGPSTVLRLTVVRDR